MALPEEVCGYDYDRETKRLTVNCIGCTHEQSIEDSPTCMERTLSKIIELKGAVTSISLAGREEIEYPFDQTQLLVEIANLAGRYLQEGISYEKLGGGEGCTRCYPERFSFLDRLLRKLLGDPIGAYLILKRQIRRERIKLEKTKSSRCERCYRHYISVLEDLKKRLGETELVSMVSGKLAGYEIGDRSLYREIFKPTVRPNFMLTRYMLTPPEGTQVDQYKVNDTKVTIYRVPGVRYYYHTAPPEFTLSEEKYSIVSQARKVMMGHKPKFTEFAEPERMRKIMKNIGTDMVRSIASRRGLSLPYEEVERLSNILARYTAGFGILEVLLADPRIQDIYVNSPVGRNPIYIYHSDYEECETNLIPTMADAESWATRFRILSGRALDESNPVLDTRIEVPGGTARVAAITKTLSPYGLGFTLRRHRARPWTFPLFIQNKMISPLSAGLLSFLIDGGRTILVGGTRSSGKCVTGDTLVKLANGKTKQIKKIVNEVFAKEDPIKLEGDEVAVPSNLEVLTLNNKLKLEPAKVSLVWKRKAPKKLIKVTTSMGREIVTTPEHPYFIKGKEIGIIKADRLKKGLKIAVSKDWGEKRLDGICWDQVEKVKKVVPSGSYVYDLTVEPTHNFLANGLVAHNTSLLGSMLLEIMRKYRIVVSEDTLELPVSQLTKLGYNIERLKTRSVITRLETEVPAEEGIRTALRLGDSCLIVGEVRGREARALFEAMRIGAMANVVAGTIHGESAYAIWDRVVHDLEVPNTSFKAIDVIAICNMLKSPSALKRFRRVVDITEVRKHWTEEPLEEGGFVDLMTYDTKKDKLVPKDVLLNGDSIVIQSIMERVREWKGDFKKVWDNITLRAKIKKALVDLSERLDRPELLEAPFVVRSNEKFHLISDQVKKEIGVAEPDEVYSRWEDWIKKETR